mmetsp:Transcript_25506/g.83994  ORF Transcript_25506/g.83994 Transcript_25506/m.83994 type:complete len:269 (-) Transcript_25506:328-1134(-)
MILAREAVAMQLRRPCTKRRRRRVASGRAVHQQRLVVAASRAGAKEELLSLLGAGDDGAARTGEGGALDRARVEELVEELKEANPTPDAARSPLLLGRWELLTTFQAGVSGVSFFDVGSWRRYIWEGGPSPVQTLVVGSGRVSSVEQRLEDPNAAGSKWQNTVAGLPGGATLVIEAELEGVRSDDPSAFDYRFSGGFFKLPSGASLPYPVPFDVLEALRPGQTRGWLSTPYLDDNLRISVGQKGSVFVLRRPPGAMQPEKEKLISQAE